LPFFRDLVDGFGSATGASPPETGAADSFSSAVSFLFAK
jgi:hypothetical protein